MRRLICAAFMCLSGVSPVAAQLPLTGAGSGTSGFSPASIPNLVFWVDASQSATVTLNVGDVSAIADLSGGSHNASQGTAGQQPAYTAADIGGRNAIVFTGSNNDLLTLATATALTQNVAAFSCFGVLKPTVDATMTPIRFLGGGGNNRFVVETVVTTGRLRLSTRRLDADATSADTNASVVFTLGSAGAFVTSMNYVTGAGRLRVGATGADFTASWAAGGNTSNTASSSDPSLGRATSSQWTGSIGEMACWQTALSLTDENNLIAYAAAKWSTP